MVDHPERGVSITFSLRVSVCICLNIYDAHRMRSCELVCVAFRYIHPSLRLNSQEGKCADTNLSDPCTCKSYPGPFSALLQALCLATICLRRRGWYANEDIPLNVVQQEPLLVMPLGLNINSLDAWRGFFVGDGKPDMPVDLEKV